MSEIFLEFQKKKKKEKPKPTVCSLLYGCLCKIPETLRGGCFLETVGKWLLTF